MITSQHYIRKALDAFIETFSSARVRYEYDRSAQVHVVEVVPNKMFRSNEAYIAWESEMWDKFIELYPGENLCFISDDALVGIEHAEYALCGKDYARGESKAQRPAPASRKPKAQAMEYA